MMTKSSETVQTFAHMHIVIQESLESYNGFFRFPVWGCVEQIGNQFDKRCCSISNVVVRFCHLEYHILWNCWVRKQNE